MNKFRRQRLVVGSVLAGHLLSLPAFGSVNVHNLAPSANPAYTLTEDALIPANWGQVEGKNADSQDGRLFLGMHYDLINDPLVELDSTETRRTGNVIENLHTLNLAAGYGLTNSVQVGVAAAMSLVTFPTVPSGGTSISGFTGTKAGLTDSRFFVKWRINDSNAPVAFAVMPEIHMPTGDRALYLSNGSWGAGLRLIAERDFGPIIAAANIGARAIPGARLQNIDVRGALPMSLGVMLPIGPRWAINADIAGEVPLPVDSGQVPGMLYLGYRYKMSELSAGMGVGIGAVDGFSSANFRFIAGVTFTPSLRAAEPVKVAEAPKPAPVVEPPKPEPKPLPRVVFTPKEIKISEEVKFEHAKARLTAGGKNLLDEVAKVIKENKSNYKLIVIEGHTNELGTYPFNQKLSEQRAASVKEYLSSRGVTAKTLLTVGYGKTKPKKLKGLSLSRDAKLQAERRVAFKVIN